MDDVRITESPILRYDAGRELQIIWLEAVQVMVWDILGPEEITLRASSFLIQKARIWRTIRSGIFDWLDGIIPTRKWLRRPERSAPRPDPEDSDSYESWIFEHLRSDWNRIYSELARRSTFIGYVTGILSGRLGLPPERTAAMGMFDYHLALKEKNLPGLDEMDKLAARDGISLERAYALAYADRHGSEWVAVYDENGNRAGRVYEVISALFRRQVADSIAAGESIEQLRSRMAFPDLLAELEAGHITEEEYLDWSQRHLNRDFTRFALTEASFAFNHGRLAYMSEFVRKTGKAVYVRFGR